MSYHKILGIQMSVGMNFPCLLLLAGDHMDEMKVDTGFTTYTKIHSKFSTNFGCKIINILGKKQDNLYNLADDF